MVYKLSNFARRYSNIFFYLNRKNKIIIRIILHNYLFQHITLNIVAHVKSDPLKAEKSSESQTRFRLQEPFQKILRCW